MAPQDTFIEEEDDTCPLCIEEFDLSDRNFRPCPCGYQICQFCFNNIKNTMNGLCPACRRPYDEKTIQWKVVTADEVAEFRANIQKNQKKRAAEQRQKEVQKRESEKENRKNLVGVRVVQKNLVYVTGLTPTVREDELLKTLRKPEFFGQYGNIQKISISNRKSSDGQNQSLGIYVTFEKKEEAQRCIQAVNGSQNGDRVLKAQLGTTKYCSAWLRHEQCTNRQCMFLHELGDEEDSYTRQDLSSMNSIQTQRPLAAGGARSTSRQQMHPPPQSQPMARSSSRDDSENGDASALPSSANWARHPQVRSRRGSHATSGAASSPAISMSLPVTAESAQESELAIQEEPERPPAQASNTSTEAPPSRASSTVPKSDADHHDKVLASCVKAIQVANFANISWDDAMAENFPPLFDPYGAARRRAFREAEERRLGVDQESQSEAQEASEGEPESSGSLALGGEPEDGTHGQGGVFDQRRGRGQPPIQRSSNDAFGAGLATNLMQPSGLSNAGSRSMTPQQQQQLFNRPQASFADHLPPGITPSQTGLFQGQGHNRQTSRYSFANEGASSSTSVKLAANPRVMAQQASMMPTAFNSQSGGQYYQSSMPGPPPGLKSTGTPPNMFGQGHGFGGAGFGGQKDTSEILQNLIHSRGRTGGAQAHDAGKREYMFPSSFSNQYPPSTSTTPAPASGLLASLYGNQPGAFQDFGSKQKKKGKKHRHANTSSSGGSALVDLADPSILQARMQHQQSNAGVGQGLFGSQSQDDELLSMDEATSTVDALVSEDDFSAGTQYYSTPAAPPGLGFVSFQPPPVASDAIPSSPAATRQTPTPIIPLKPFEQTPKKAPSAETKKTVKARAVETGLSKQIASSSKQLLQEADFPALDAKATPQAPAPAPATPVQPKAVATAPASSKKTPVQPPTNTTAKPPTPAPYSAGPAVETPKKAGKKPVPGILNIAAATRTSQQAKVAESSSAVDKTASDQASGFPALPTPTAAAVSSPVARSGPRSLRLVPTPKTEAAPTLSMSIDTKHHGRSSVLPTNRPGTPASEIISDNASVVSTTMSGSRASSPPPSRVGAAAVRSTTKSQQRKERKQATKKEAEKIASQPIPEKEAEVGPIVGRKKKQKKDKSSGSSLTPVQSRPATPGPAAVKEEPAKAQTVTDEKPAKSKKAQPEPQLEPKPAPKSESPAPKSKSKQATVAEVVDTPQEEQQDTGSKTPETERHLPTPQSILQDLVAKGDIADPEQIALLKLLTASQPQRHDLKDSLNAKDMMASSRSMITEEDQAALLDGKAVRKILDGVRVLLTPNGDCVRNLTEEEETRFLELQKLIAAATNGPASYVHTRHESAGGFSLVKGRAVPNGPPGYFPQSSDGKNRDPVAKIQREEAIYCINQYVLPRLSLGTSWKNSLGQDAKAPHPGSLSSLAPWIFNSAAASAGAHHDPAAVAGDPDIADATAPLKTMADIDSTSTALGNTSTAVATSGAAAGGTSSSASSASPFSSVPLLSAEDAESALAVARRESEKLEKSLNVVIKKNRRLLLASGH
ncbi:uncharacterized protein E0L32_005337 [Thyridium curvatum]|uniref:General negative regulator of transcription subunit 4 n=1 Tax=Thyridium curvatum TaxID=1093900 RepID=A0A507AV13_9PEZI|nr:uncharacterized protein E0L32_005337 [Thyridium curvatum]TPX14645.1 hypothetical protein E0L32_005337 [Thyridium curvatum]